MDSLAFLCILFGVFPNALPLKYLVNPVISNVTYTGLWAPGLTSTLIVVGLILGFIIYLMGDLKGIREADAFVGGEALSEDERVTGTGFYDTIQNLSGLHRIYKGAKAKWFDIYDQLMHLSSFLSEQFRKAHTGILNTYVLWLCAGLAILFILFFFI